MGTTKRILPINHFLEVSMNHLAQRKAAMKAAQDRCPGAELHWRDGRICFVSTGMTVEGTPYIPKPQAPAPKPQPELWTHRYANGFGRTPSRHVNSVRRV